MNQKVRESLSAIMDGEGDELELRRVLKSLGGSSEEADAWRRYHVIGSVMRRERDIDVSVDLSASIRQRIEAQQRPVVSHSDPAVVAHGDAVVKRHAGPFSFMGSAAVAAAVSLMVITGVQVYRGAGSSTPSADTTLASQASVSGSAISGAAIGSLSGEGSASSSGGVSTVGLVSEPVNGSYASADGRSLFPSYMGTDSNAEARQQARLLKGFLEQHAQAADFQPQGQYGTISARYLGSGQGAVSAQ